MPRSRLDRRFVGAKPASRFHPVRCTPSAPSAGAEAGSSLASSSRPLALSERAVLSRRDARSKVSTPGFRNGARRTALAPKPLILAVLSPLGDMRDPEKMRVARSEKQTERPAHKLITVCKFGLCNGSALARPEGPETAFK